MTTHGMRNTPEYRVWVAMKQRCTNQNLKGWHRYGGRGIKVYAEWLNDFPAFFAYVGKKPSPKHSLDRFPNNDGNYEPGNVRWATSKEQQNNRSSNTWITVGERTLNITQWAEAIGTTPGAICERIWRGYTPEDAVTTPFYRGLAADNSPTRKVTEIQVRSIRLMYRHGWSSRRLALLFGLKKPGMYSILSRQNWKNVA